MNDNIYLSVHRAAVLTGRYQTRSGIYPKGIDPNDLGGKAWLIILQVLFNRNKIGMVL